MKKEVAFVGILLWLLAIKYTGSQVLEICQDADLGNECILTCTTNDNHQVISFSKTSDLSTSLGTCFANTGFCLSADGTKYNITQSGGVTKFAILSHSKSDVGTWRCDYGGISHQDKNVSWAKLPTSSASTGISANTVVSSSSRISVIVGVGCLYSESEPVVSLKFLPGTSKSSMICKKTATICSDTDYSAYDCNKTITSTDANCNTVYTVQLEVSVTHTRNVFAQNLFSPYTLTFECSSCQNRKCSWVCWISIIVEIIFAIVFLLVDLWLCGYRNILSRKYEKYFKLAKLEITRNTKPAKIESVKMIVNGIETKEKWNYSDKHGHAFCNISFDQTGLYTCDVSLEKQPNITFDFNFKGCENDKNVEKCIEFGNNIKLRNGTVGKTMNVQWRHDRNIKQFTSTPNNIYNSKSLVSYESEGQNKDMLVINIITIFDLTIPDLKKRVKIRIFSFTIPSCIIVVLGIIIWIIHHKEYEWFCCMDWYLPVAIILTVLVIFFYGLVFFLLLKKQHEWWIVAKSWRKISYTHTSPEDGVGNTDQFIYQDDENNTSRNTDPFGHKADENNTSRNKDPFGHNADENNTLRNKDPFGHKADENNTSRNTKAEENITLRNTDSFGHKADENNTSRNKDSFGHKADENNTSRNTDSFGHKADENNTSRNTKAEENITLRNTDSFGRKADENNTSRDTELLRHKGDENNTSWRAETIQAETAKYIGNSPLDKKPNNMTLPKLTDVESTNTTPSLERAGKLQPIDGQQKKDPKNLGNQTRKKGGKNEKKKKTNDQDSNANNEGLEGDN